MQKKHKPVHKPAPRKPVKSIKATSKESNGKPEPKQSNPTPPETKRTPPPAVSDGNTKAGIIIR